MVFNFFQKQYTKTTDIQVLKNSTLYHKISRLCGGDLLQRLSVKISSNIRDTITQSHCLYANDNCVLTK